MVKCAMDMEIQISQYYFQFLLRRCDIEKLPHLVLDELYRKRKFFMCSYTFLKLNWSLSNFGIIFDLMKRIQRITPYRHFIVNN